MIEITIKDLDGTDFIIDIEGERPEDIELEVKEYVKTKYDKFALERISETEFAIIRDEKGRLEEYFNINPFAGSYRSDVKKAFDSYYKSRISNCENDLDKLAKLTRLSNLSATPLPIHSYHKFSKEETWILLKNISHLKFYFKYSLDPVCKNMDDLEETIKLLQNAEGNLSVDCLRRYVGTYANAIFSRLLKMNDHEKLRRLISHFPKSEKFSYYARSSNLNKALINGDELSISICRDNCLERSDISYAIKNNSLEIIKLMAKKDTKFTINDLEDAFIRGDIEIIKLIFNNLKNCHLYEAFTLSIKYQNIEILGMSIQKGVKSIPSDIYEKLTNKEQFDIIYKRILTDLYGYAYTELPKKLKSIRDSLKDVEYEFYYDYGKKDFLQRVKKI